MRPQQISRQVCDKRSTPPINPGTCPSLAQLLLECFSCAAKRPTAVEAHARLVNMRSALLLPNLPLRNVPPTGWQQSHQILQPSLTANSNSLSLSVYHDNACSTVQNTLRM